MKSKPEKKTPLLEDDEGKFFASVCESYTSSHYMPETVLWFMVIARAKMDATIQSKKKSEMLARAEAIDWLTKWSKDLAEVCDHANVSPEKLLSSTKKLFQK
jgi:hypothetical protein